MHGLDRWRGRVFHEGDEFGERCAASLSSTAGTVAYPCSTEPMRLVKSAAAALVRREEKGCFQDLETLWCRSGKKGSFLPVGHEPEPLRKCSSSLDDWDSRGSSSQSKLSSVARQNLHELSIGRRRHIERQVMRPQSPQSWRPRYIKYPPT